MAKEIYGAIWQQVHVKLCQWSSDCSPLALNPALGLIYSPCSDSHREFSLMICVLMLCHSPPYYNCTSPYHSSLFVLRLPLPLWSTLSDSMYISLGRCPPHLPLSFSLTFQEADDFSPLPCIKRMELFKAHEGDVVVWVVHDGQTCSRDADVQVSVVRAERRVCEEWKRCCV